AVEVGPRASLGTAGVVAARRYGRPAGFTRHQGREGAVLRGPVPQLPVGAVTPAVGVAFGGERAGVRLAGVDGRERGTGHLDGQVAARERPVPEVAGAAVAPAVRLCRVGHAARVVAAGRER